MLRWILFDALGAVFDPSGSISFVLSLTRVLPSVFALCGYQLVVIGSLLMDSSNLVHQSIGLVLSFEEQFDSNSCTQQLSSRMIPH